LLEDTVNLGFKLNRKVNAAWSVKRLKLEHDNWAKEYTEIVMELSNRPLNIHPAFIELSKVIDGTLLKTTKDLAVEGAQQKHCVASYSSTIDSGRTAIFHINGFTAEVIKNGTQFELKQFNGFANKRAPDEIRNKVAGFLVSFSENNKHIFSLPHQRIQHEDYFTTQLPF